MAKKFFKLVNINQRYRKNEMIYFLFGSQGMCPSTVSMHKSISVCKSICIFQVTENAKFQA